MSRVDFTRSLRSANDAAIAAVNGTSINATASDAAINSASDAVHNAKEAQKTDAHYSWDLSPIGDVLALEEQIRADVAAFTAYKSQLPIIQEKKDVTAFCQVHAAREKILQALSQLEMSVTLQMSLNLKDEASKKKSMQIDELGTDVSNQIRFFTQWFSKLPDQTAKEFANATTSDAYPLGKLHQNAKHLKNEAEENLLALKNTTGSNALCQIYDAIPAGWEFKFDGKIQSYAQMRAYAHNQNRAKRKKSAELLKEKYTYHLDTLSDIYINVVKDHLNEVLKIRGYAHTAQPRLIGEGFSQKALDALFASTKRNVSLFQDVFAIRKKLLGLDTLELYDLYAPIGSSQKLSLAQAKSAILSSLKTRHPHFGAQVESLFAKHVDTTPKPNKRGGAFCYSIPKINPYVFMQYLGTQHDAFTLAHELGHAVHALHTKNLTTTSAHASLSVCESASTYFEELLFEYVLARAKPTQQIAMLMSYLGDKYATIVRQTYISLFEMEAHALIEKGATKTELNAIWTRIQKEQFEPVVSVPDELISWCYIPHIYHTPFYCYSYAVGNTLSLALTQVDPSVVEKYLSVGGTRSAIDTARVAGIDLESEATYDTAYAVIRKRVEQLKELVAKQN